MNIPKNKIIVSTWEDYAFQAKILVTDDNKLIASNEDPLTIPCFDVLGFHCIPHCGVYGDNYNICLPFVLLQIEGLNTRSTILQNMLPLTLHQYLSDLPEVTPLEFFILVHSTPARSECQKFMCNNTNEVNMMYHCWLYSTIKFDEHTTASKLVKMGIFGAHGIRPVHQDLKDAGITFDKVEERTVAIHSLSFSPENAQFQLTDEVPVAHFFAFAQSANRFVISLHILPETIESEESLREAVKSSSTLHELVQNIFNVDYASGTTLSRVLYLHK